MRQAQAAAAVMAAAAAAAQVWSGTVLSPCKYLATQLRRHPPLPLVCSSGAGQLVELSCNARSEHWKFLHSSLTAHSPARLNHVTVATLTTAVICKWLVIGRNLLGQ
jgi:hypothetical protein